MSITIQAQSPLRGLCSIIGHRGAPGYGGENTLWGFQKALDLGADGFELDVIATKDGKLIVAHDYDLKRLLGEEQLQSMFPDREPISTNFTQEELQSLKVTFPAPGEERYDYKNLPDSYALPTLAQALDLLLENRETKSRPDLKIYIEIKIDKKHIHTAPLNSISHHVTSALKEKGLLTDQNVWIQSFDPDMMDVIGKNFLLKEIPKCQLGFTSMSMTKKLQDPKKAKKYLKKQILDRNLNMLHFSKVSAKYMMDNMDPSFIQVAHNMNIPIHLYTFRDPNSEIDYKFLAGLGVKGFSSAEAELIYFLEKGVDAIMTDYITSALAARKKASQVKP